MSQTERKIKVKDGGSIMMENMERVVLLSLFTPICDRPLPSGGFSRKADLLLPL